MKSSPARNKRMKKQKSTIFATTKVIFMQRCATFFTTKERKLKFSAHTSLDGIISKNGGNNCMVKAKEKTEKGFSRRRRHSPPIFTRSANTYKTASGTSSRRSFSPMN